MDLLRMELKDYLSYKQETIDLHKKDGLYLIIGRNDENCDESEGNGSGKTSLVGAVPFALYGRARGVFDKDLRNEDVIRKDENDEIAKKAEVSIMFEKGGAYYKVKRTVNAKGNQTVSLYSSLSYPAKKWEDLSLKAGVNKRTSKRESGILRTEQKIADVIGCDMELFINSVFFEQSNIDTFARGSLGDKDGLIKNAIGINRWTDYGNLMGEDLKSVEAEINRNNAIIEDQGDLTDLGEQVGDLEKSIKNVKIVIKELNDKVFLGKDNVEQVTKELATIEEKMKGIAKKKEELIAVKEKMKSASFKIDKCDNDLILCKKNGEEITKESEEKEMDIKVNDNTIAKFKKQSKGFTKADLKECTDLMEEIRAIISKNKAEMNSLTAQAKKIDSAICPLGLECEKLTEESKEELKDGLRKKYSKREFVVKKQEARIVKGNERIYAIEDSLEADSKIEYYELKKESNKKDIDRLYDKLNDASNKGKELATLRKELLQEHLQYKSEFGDLSEEIENVNEVEIDDCKTRLRESKVALLRDEQDYDNAKVQQSKYEGTLKNVKASIVKINELKKGFSALQDKRNIIKESQAIVKKEIPHLLIGNAIPEIKRYSREFLYKLSDGRMDIDFKLERDLKGNSGTANAFDIFINVDGKWLKYAQTSGGQRARADVAIHLAYVCFMSNMSKSKLETIFLDEVGAPLDKKGVENFVEIIKELKERYRFKKIFNITQNIEMKKMIDKRLLVTLTKEGSKVKMI